MSKGTSFAVAIPVGSWHPLISETLESLAVQTPPLQVALMDASNDPRVAEAVRSSSLDLAYYRTGPDSGQSAAIIEGWNNTESDFVFWLNADDRLAPDTLELVHAALLAEPTLDVVYGLSNFVNTSGNVVGSHDQVEHISSLILRSNIISQPSCFARRTSVEVVGGLNPALHFVMDWDLWIRLFNSGAKFHFIQQNLSFVFMGRATKTYQVSWRRLTEVFGLVRRNAGGWAATKSLFSLAAETLSRRKLAP